MPQCASEFQSDLASVLRALVQAAVGEMHKVLQEGTGLLLTLHDQSESEKIKEEMRTETEQKTKHFASVMEVLGNEALAKILKLVDETESLLDPERETFSETRPKHPGRILNILSVGQLEEEHSYHGCRKSSEKKPSDENSYAEELERPESPFTPAVSLKDQFGNINVKSIVEGHMASGEAGPQGGGSEAGQDGPSLVGWQSFICCDCGQNFTSSSDLQSHQQVHSGQTLFSCALCNQTFTHEKILTDHHCVHSDDQRERSGQFFEKAELLATHEPLHAGEKPFSCDLCGKAFSLAQNLTRHRQTHAGKKSFTCSICCKSFSRAKALLTHQLIHTGQKPHSCAQCGRAFRHLVNLRAHELIHTDLRPHACDVCGKSFRHSVNLKIHKRVHTGEKPFTCTECGRSFSQKSSLVSHSRTHSSLRPFSCNYCKKDFNNANSLKLHERTHTGEKPYGCEFCGKSFSQGSHLHTHRRHMHAGGKQYICDKCGKRYADPRNLKLHKCVYA